MFYYVIELLNSNKKFPFYFITPLAYSYGNAAEQIYLVSAENSIKKKIVILNNNYLTKLLKYRTANKNLFSDLVINGHDQNEIKLLRFIFSFLFFIEFFLRRLFVIYIFDLLKIKINELKRFPYIGIEKIICYNKKFNFENVDAINLEQSKINLNLNIIIQCQLLIKKYNPNNRKIVTIHVRDSMYKTDSFKRNYRNSNINNCVELIKFLISRDYIIFRLGTNPCNEVNFNDKNFIDYAKLDIQSSRLDLFLIEQSDFFIGTGSGPRAVAEMFSKPLLILNSDDFSDIPLKKMDRVLYKNFFSKKDFDSYSKALSVMKLLELDYNFYDPELYLQDFILKENTEEEILNAGKEFVSNLKTKNFLLSKEQNQFNKLLKKKIQYFYTENNNNTVKYHIESLRYIKRCKSMEGSICKSYFTKY